MRRVLAACSIVALLLVSTGLALPGRAAAFSGFGARSASEQYGQAMTFSVSLPGGAPDRLELLLRFGPDPDSTVVAPVAASGSRATYTWDASSDYVTPNTPVAYQWRATTGGSVTLSPSATLLYADNRPGLDWRSALIGQATVHWYGGAEAQARRFGDLTSGAVARAQQTLGHALDGPIDIFVYDSQSDFFGALGPGAREWTGAATFPDIRTVFMWLGGGGTDYLDTALIHEVTHVVFYDATRNPYHDPARWLNEGFSVWSEQQNAECGGADGSQRGVERALQLRRDHRPVPDRQPGLVALLRRGSDHGRHDHPQLRGQGDGRHRCGLSLGRDRCRGVAGRDRRQRGPAVRGIFPLVRRERAAAGGGGQHRAIGGPDRRAGQCSTDCPGFRRDGRQRFTLRRLAGDGRRGQCGARIRRDGCPGADRRAWRVLVPAPGGGTPWLIGRARAGATSRRLAFPVRRGRGSASTWTLSIAVALGITGFVAAAQWNSSVARQQYTTSAQQVLAGQVLTLESEQKDLRQQLADAEAQVQQFQTQTAGSQTALDLVNRQLAAARLAAGLTKVTGSGVVVEIADSKRPSRRATTPRTTSCWWTTSMTWWRRSGRPARRPSRSTTNAW